MRAMSRQSTITPSPRPFLIDTDMLKRDFASAFRQTSGAGKIIELANVSWRPSPFILDFLKPLWGLLRVAGVFPVNREQARFTFSLVSPATAYASCVFVAMSVYALYVTDRRIAMMSDSTPSFNTLVFFFLYILIALPQLVPVLHLLEARSVAAYLDDWTELQLCVENLSGNSFVCTRSRRKVLVLCVLLPCASCLFMLLEYHLLDTYFPNELPFYFYTNTLVYLHVALWHFLCGALIETADHLIDSLEMEFQRPGPHLPPIVIKYMTAWCRLGRLASDTGHVMVYTLAFILVLWSTVLLLSLYGSLPGGANQDFPITREVGLAISTAVVFAVIFVICNSAYLTTDTVGRAFIDRLGILAISDKFAQSEMDQFLKAAAAKPPVINLGGYVDINRSLLTSLFSSLATYLIVLVQFKMSDSSGGANSPKNFPA